MSRRNNNTAIDAENCSVIVIEQIPPDFIGAIYQESVECPNLSAHSNQIAPSSYEIRWVPESQCILAILKTARDINAWLVHNSIDIVMRFDNAVLR